MRTPMRLPPEPGNRFRFDRACGRGEAAMAREDGPLDAGAGGVNFSSGSSVPVVLGAYFCAQVRGF